MKSRKVYVINDLFDQSPQGEQQLKDFRDEYLPNLEVDAFYFATNQPMVAQVDEAVRRAIAGRYDLVILDAYFGPLGKPDTRLGIDRALPKLVAAGIPIILLSALAEKEQVIANVHEVQKEKQVRYLSSDRMELLIDYIEAMLPLSSDENASVDYGFRYRQQEEIDRRRNLQDTFDGLARGIGSHALEIPLIAPASNFLGKPPRPLPEKFSNKLFTAVTTDGRAMAVRYEGTVLTAKLVAADARRADQFDSKYHYFQEMVRVESTADLDEKHFRSFYQAGIEVFTKDIAIHYRNTADVLEMTVKLLRDFGLTPTLRLSHVSLLPSVLDPLELDPFMKRRLIGVLEKGTDENVVETLRLCSLPEEAQNVLGKLASLRGAPVNEAVDFLTANRATNLQTCAAFETLYPLLKDRGLLDCCRFDPGIYRSLDFYSGITMQGDVPGMNECLGGGDFTGLVESFGVIGPIYSFGMAVGVERLLSLKGLRV